MIECLNCGATGHKITKRDCNGRMVCIGCGSSKLVDDEYLRGFIDE